MPNKMWYAYLKAAQFASATVFKPKLSELLHNRKFQSLKLAILNVAQAPRAQKPKWSLTGQQLFPTAMPGLQPFQKTQTNILAVLSHVILNVNHWFSKIVTMQHTLMRFLLAQTLWKKVSWQKMCFCESLVLKCNRSCDTQLFKGN